MDTKNALLYTVPLFGNYPITKDKLHYYFHGMLDKYNQLKENNDNKSIKELMGIIR